MSTPFPFALSTAQRSIHDACLLDPDSPVFRVADVVEIDGRVDLDVLVAAITATVDETDALWVDVVDGSDGPQQTWRERVASRPTVRDLRDVRDGETVARAWMEEDLDADGHGFGHDQVLFLLSDERTWWYQRYHHVHLDGYAVAAISRRVAHRVRAASSGVEPDPGFGRLVDLWAEEAGYAESEPARRAEDWFTELLEPADGVPAAVTPLTGRTAAATRRPIRREVRLDPAAHEALEAITARDRRLTWADVHLAIFAAFVGRVTGREDVVLALPVAARATPLSVRTPSMSVNVLPVRLAVPRHASLLDLALDHAAVLSRVRRHQRLRGELLAARRSVAGESVLLRGPAINIKPFVEVLDLGTARGHLRNLQAGPVDDLDLTVVPTERGGLQLVMEANPDLYDDLDLRRHADSFAAFASGVLARPDVPMGQVPLGGPVEEPLSSRVVVPLDVSERLAATVARDPGALAVRSGADSVTFGELRRRVDEWATVIRGLGIGSGGLVAIGLERGVDLVTAILAVLEANAAYLPIDLAYPDERVDHLLADADPAVVLTRAGTRLASDPRALRIEDHRIIDAPAAPPAGPPAVRHPDSLAYVVYTSGSTGRPKGVMVSRRSLAFFTTHHAEGLFADVARAAGRRLRAAHTASFSFDSSWEQLIWLLDGHELVVYDEDDRRDAFELVGAIARDGIDTLDVTPSMAVALVEQGLLESTHVPRLFLIGGESASDELWRALASSGMVSHNFYGPTEATVDALGAAVVGDRSTIGRPLDGTGIRVLDSALQPVPRGATGELYLVGPHLARGYAGRPAQTASRFVADPVCTAGERMYRTGDLVRVEPDGSVSYLGREDDQVKIRGHRIELAEVVAALEGLAEVRQAHVGVTPEPMRLVAHVVAPGADPETLRSHLARSLPDHLVPSAVVVLDSFPQTAHGKLDVSALPAPQWSSRERVAPSTPEESAVCEAMATVLGLDGASVVDDFFVLGGDSISAIAVAGRVRAAGWQMRPRDLFATRTARALARELVPVPVADAADVADEPTGSVPMPPVAASTLALVTDLADLDGYAQHVTLRLPHALPDMVLATVLDALTERHPALRLRLDDVLDARPTLVVGDSCPPPALLDAPDVATGVAMALDALEPRSGRLVAAARVRSADQLVLAVHHLAVDGVSWRLLVADLAILLAGGELAAVDATSWRGHVLALARHAESGGFRGELDHWLRVTALDDVASGLVPAAGDTVATARRSVVMIDAPTSRAVLTDLPERLDCRPDAVLAGLVALAISRGAQETEEAPASHLLMTWETHGREPIGAGEDLSATVGWFTEEFPVAIDLAGLDSRTDAVAAAIKAAHQARLEVPGEGSGFGALGHLDPASRGSLEGARRPRVLLNYLGRFDGAGTDLLVGDQPFATHVPPGFALTHGLELNVFATDEGLALEWTVAPGLEAAASLIARHLDAVLVEAVAEVGRPRRGTLVPARCTLPGADQAGIDAAEAELGPLRDVAPLTPLQEGLLFHALSDGEDDVYTTLTTLRLTAVEGVDAARIDRAVQTVVARHPQLAARFTADRFGRPAQLVPAAPTVELEVIELAGRRASLTEELAAARAGVLAQPFDLGNGPLIRFTLVRHDDGADLLLAAHHLVADGWSTPIVVDDLLRAYAGEPGGDPAEGYRAFRRYLELVAADDAQVGRQAWATHLSGVANGTRIAPDMPVGATTAVQVPLERDLGGRLAASLRAGGLTLSAALSGAWAFALGRRLGTPDVVFGTTVAGRTAEIPGIETVVGLLSQTIPVRVAPRADESWRDLLDRVQVESAQMQDVDRTSLADIEDASGVTGLFDTLVVVENYPAVELPERGGIRLDGIDNEGGTHYPLTLTALPGERLALVVDADLGRVDSGVVDAIVADLVVALRAMAADLSTLVSSAATSTPVALRGPAPQRQPDVVESFLDAVRRNPDSPAVQSAAGDLTFAELATRAAGILEQLDAQGLAAGDLVALALPRAPDAIAAIVACLAGGYGYVPLDTTYPIDRLRQTIEDAAPSAVIAEHETWDVSPGVPVVVPRSPDVRTQRLSRRDVGDRSVAYVIYTSGSTGRPKGVVIERGAMTRHFHGLRAQREDDVVTTVRRRFGRDQVHALVSASLSFDTSLGQLHWLFAGHTLVLLDDDERRDPALIAQAVVERAVDVADLAPVLAEQLLDHGVLDGPDAMTLLYLGGEAVPPGLWTRLRAVSTPTINLYGPTESTVDALGARVDSSPVPVIGAPVSGVVAYVLDPWLRPVPSGTLGELYLAGTQLARGYLGRPALTAERFVAHPWGTAGERLYRTGDVVRLGADGQVEFTGRDDDQVKIGGHRIELGEALALVAAVDGVASAAVLADPPGPTAERLLAFVVRSGSAGSDDDFAADVRATLLDRAPHHLVPSAVMVLDHLPMTVNDKVDRARLRAMEVPVWSTGPARVRPSTPAEHSLAAAVQDVLGVADPSMDDDFFVLGGHSLTALRVLGAMRREGWTLGVRDVFEGRELATIAARAVPGAGTAATGDAARLASLLRDGGETGVSDAQRRLLFLAELEGPTATYNVPVTHLVVGDVDEMRLAEAWSTVVCRHAALRTHFLSRDGSFSARVAPSSVAARLVLRDVDDLAAAVAVEESHVFDVFVEPPVRLSLLRAADGLALVLCAHHVVIDDWSVGIVIDELSALMRGDELPPLPDTSQDVARHLDRGRSPVVGRELDYWRQALQGLPAELELPHDRPRGDRPTYRAHARSLAIDTDLLAALRAVGARLGASPLMVLQTAVATLARGLGAGSDVCLGMPVALRDDPAAAATVGYLLNTLPVRLDVSGSGSFLDHLARTRAVVLDVVDHRSIAFERIVEMVAPPRSLARHPLFQVMVSHEDGGGATLALPGASVTPSEGHHDSARVDLAVRLVEASGVAPRLHLSAAADLFDESSTELLGRRLLAWLDRVLASPDTPLAGIDALLDEERPRAVSDHVRRDVPPPSVLARFIAQVRQDPDRLALVTADGELTYGALAGRAATLTELLRARGVGRDDLVAIAVPRGVDLVVALLGVLGAGATYLPLDTEYPAGRLQDMLADARPVAVLISPHTAGIGHGLPEIDVRAMREVDPEGDALEMLDVSAGAHGAYTIYTSGSTGRPKGVMISTAAMAAFVDHVHRDLRLEPTDRMLAVTTISFDIAVLEIYVPLVSGAAVVLADAEQVRDPDLLVGLAGQHEVTHLQATPSLWRPLLEAHPSAFAGITALVGGEALPPDLADVMVRCCRSVTNEYGPTEATVWATSSDVAAARDRGEPVTIGRPYLDVGALVLDDQLRPVPDGVAGELYLAGEQLARGYHDRFALTAERFVAHPRGRAGERMYRTGDLVRRDVAGPLHFVRRVDDQVKVLGHRIELGEVETHLGRLPGVGTAAATVRVDASGTGRLLGYVVADDGSTLDVVALRVELSSRVPAQFVPQQVVQIDALPLTLNGKVDRQRLPEPGTLAVAEGRAPSGPAEEIVCRAVAEVLGLPSVGPDHAFFELGGDSITSIRLVSVARAAGLRLTPRDVFVQPTLAALAGAGELESPAAARPPRRRDSREARSRIALGAEDLARIDSLLGRNR